MAVRAETLFVAVRDTVVVGRRVAVRDTTAVDDGAAAVVLRVTSRTVPRPDTTVVAERGFGAADVAEYAGPSANKVAIRIGHIKIFAIGRFKLLSL